MPKYFRLIGLSVFVGIIFVNSLLGQGQLLQEDQAFQFAAQLAQRGMHDLAALQFLRFVETYPTSPLAPQAIFRAAQSYEANHQPDKASEAYLRLLLSYPQADCTDKAFFNRAMLLASAGNHLEAALTFERIRLFRPESELVPSAMLQAARQYLLINDVKRAQAAAFYILEKYQALPIRWETHLFLATLYRQINQPKSALKELDNLKGERLDADLSVRVLLLRGQILQSLGQYAAADSLLESLLTRDAVNDSIGVAAVQLVQSLSGRGLDERALAIAEKALSLPLTADAKNRLHIARADIFFASKEYPQALAALERVVLEPLSPQQRLYHQFRKAAVLQKLGQQQLALDAYLRICDHADSGAAALQLKKRSCLIACDLLCGMQHPGEALRLLRQLYDEHPEWRDRILLQKALIQQEFMQDWPAARLAYTILLEFHPNSPLADDALIGIARCYEQENDFPLALRHYEQYLKLFPGGDEYALALQRWHYLREFAPMAKAPLPTAVQTTLATLLLQQGQYEQLLQWAKEQIQIYHDYRSALHYLSLALSTTDKPSNELEWTYWAALCHARLAQLAEMKDKKEEQQTQRDSLKILAELMLKNNPDDKRTQQIQYEAIIADLATMDVAYDRALFLSQSLPKITSIDSLKALLQLRLAEAWQQTAIDSANVPLMLRAAALCAELLKKDPPSALAGATLLLRAKIFTQLNQPDSAAMSLHTCIDRYSDAPQVIEAMWTLAGMLEQQRKFDEAAGLYQDLARRFYYAAAGQKAQRKYCRALFQQALYPDAEKCVLEHLYLSELQELRLYLQDELDDESLWLSAQIRIHLQKPASAIEAIKTYLALTRTGAHRNEALWTLAEMYARMNNLDAALGHYQALIAEFPQDSLSQLAHFRSAEILFDRQRYAEAKKIYEALKISGNGAGRQSAAAREVVCEYRLGNIARARTLAEAFKKQYKDRRAEATFLQEDANYCLANKDFKAAEDQFKDLASRYRDLPDGANGELGLARLYVVLNRTEEALKLLTNIPNKYADPRIIALAYVNLGEFYYENRQLDNCITAARKALEYEPISPERQRALSLLIRVYDDLRLWDSAISLLREYIENYPHADDHFSRRIQLGVFLINLKEFARGISYLRDLLPEADAESEAEIQYWIAQAYASWGSLSEALVEYLKVRYACRPTKLPWGTTALYEAGKIYLKLGELRKARSLFQQIVQENGIGDQFGRVANERVKEIDALLIKEKSAGG